MFESCKNTAVSTAILCLAACVFMVMNKTGICGISGYHHEPPFFFFFFLVKSNHHGCSLNSWKSKPEKSTSNAWIRIEQPHTHQKPANGSICTFLTFHTNMHLRLRSIIILNPTFLGENTMLVSVVQICQPMQRWNFGSCVTYCRSRVRSLLWLSG